MKPSMRQSLKLNKLNRNSGVPSWFSFRKSTSDNSNFVNDSFQLPLSQKLDIYNQKHPDLSGMIDLNSSSIQNPNHYNSNQNNPNQNNSNQNNSNQNDQNTLQNSIGQKPEMEKTQKIDLSSVEEEEYDDEDYF